MSGETPFAGHTDEQLIKEAGMGHPGYVIEAMRRLRRAVDRQSLVGTWLTVAIIALMVVQIVVAVVRVRL